MTFSFYLIVFYNFSLWFLICIGHCCCDTKFLFRNDKSILYLVIYFLHWHWHNLIKLHVNLFQFFANPYLFSHWYFYSISLITMYSSNLHSAVLLTMLSSLQLSASLWRHHLSDWNPFVQLFFSPSHLYTGYYRIWKFRMWHRGQNIKCKLVLPQIANRRCRYSA